MAESFIRCPRCGNENRAEIFSCSFCGKRLRIEKIESLQYFKKIFQRILNSLENKECNWHQKCVLFQHSLKLFYQMIYM